jgi:copper chaperone CopZ
MSHYIHHVPGRLRVKTQLIKGNEARAKAAKEHLSNVNGVRETDVNTLTGSIIIWYDVGLATSMTILDSLRHVGVIQHVTTQTVSTGAVRGNAIVEKVGETVVNKIVEMVIERSAILLIGALI